MLVYQRVFCCYFGVANIKRREKTRSSHNGWHMFLSNKTNIATAPSANTGTALETKRCGPFTCNSRAKRSPFKHSHQLSCGSKWRVHDVNWSWRRCWPLDDPRHAPGQLCNRRLSWQNLAESGRIWQNGWWLHQKSFVRHFPLLWEMDLEPGGSHFWCPMVSPTPPQGMNVLPAVA